MGADAGARGGRGGAPTTGKARGQAIGTNPSRDKGLDSPGQAGLRGGPTTGKARGQAIGTNPSRDKGLDSPGQAGFGSASPGTAGAIAAGLAETISRAISTRAARENVGRPVTPDTAQDRLGATKALGPGREEIQEPARAGAERRTDTTGQGAVAKSVTGRRKARSAATLLTSNLANTTRKTLLGV